MKTHRRKKTLVDRKVLYRLLAYNWMYFVIITAFIAVALFLPLSLRLHDSGLSWIQQGNLSRTFLFLHVNLWPVILVVFLLLSVHSLLISNKIVGPLLRFKAALRRFLQGGRWGDRQIVPEDYVRLAASDLVTVEGFGDPENNQGYGYQLWRCTFPDVYRADGKYGQFSIVIPSHRAVVTVTAHNEDNANDILRAVWSEVLPRLD